MGDKRKDKFWTVEKIAEAFQDVSCEIKGCGDETRNKMTPLYIRNKLKEIFKETECPEAVFRRRGKKQEGHFIFKNDDGVPDRIYHIFEFYDSNHEKICGSFMSDEENRLMSMLYEIRPNVRQKPCNNTYMEYRRELKDFYIKKCLRIYKEKLFVKIDVKKGRPDKRIRANIYSNQECLIEAWCEKWTNIMKIAMYLRINERILNGYICNIESSLLDEKKRRRFYLEGYRYDELEENYLQLYRMNEEDIYNECCNFYYLKNDKLLKKTRIQKKNAHVSEECYKKCVAYVAKVVSHPLQGVSIEDYLYICRRAMRELEDVCAELEEKLEMDKKYDDLIYGLKQIKKIVNEDGLKGKKNKRIKEELDKFIPVSNEPSDCVQAYDGCFDSQIPESLGRFKVDDLNHEVKTLLEEMDCHNITKEKEAVRKEIKGEVAKGENDSLIKKDVVKFCNMKIEEYYGRMELEEDGKSTYYEYKTYFLEEMRKVKIDGRRENKENHVGINYQEINDYQEAFARIRKKCVDAKMGEMGEMRVTDFLPEKENIWGIREFCTGRELI